MSKTTVADLKDTINVKGPRPFLLCKVCGAQYSANKADYWNAPVGHVFKCCGKPMAHVTERTVYTEV